MITQDTTIFNFMLELLHVNAQIVANSIFYQIKDFDKKNMNFINIWNLTHTNFFAIFNPT